MNTPAALRSTPRHARLIVGGIIAVAACLRLIHANAEFWFDEIVTVLMFVGTPFANVISTYGLANNHALNSVLVHLVASVCGADPWAVRLPAILFGVAGVWAFWFVATAIWPRMPALLGTSLFAVSYHHIYYSQNARGYSALIFFGLLATGLLLRLLDQEEPRRDRRIAAGYSVAIGLGLYAMLLMTFIVAGHASVLVACRRWRALIPLAAGVGLAALLYAPMAPSLMEYYRTHPADTGYRLLSIEFARALAPIAIVLIAGGLVSIPIVVRFARTRPLAAALLLSPVAFNVLVPLVRGQGVYPRSFIYGLAVAYLLLVDAIDWALRVRPGVAWMMAALIAVASAVQLVPYYQLPKQGFRQALAYIERHRAPADDRIGLTLGGKAARFYDPSIVLIEDASQLRAFTSRSRQPAWIISTFPGEMRLNSPELYEWLRAQAADKAEFAGVIGDGTVHVHYWSPTR